MLERRGDVAATRCAESPVDSAHLQAVREVVAHAHVRIERVALKDHRQVARLRRNAVTSPPPMTNAARVGVSSPAISRSSVLLPHPDGPTSTRNSPSSIVEVDVADAAVAVRIGLRDALRARSLPLRSALGWRPPSGRRRSGAGMPAPGARPEPSPHRCGEHLAPRHLISAAEQRDRDRNGVALRGRA